MSQFWTALDHGEIVKKIPQSFPCGPKWEVVYSQNVIELVDCCAMSLVARGSSSRDSFAESAALR